MPAIHRLGDNCTGHGCFPPRPSVTAATKVFINNIPAVVEGDHWDEHSCGSSSHTGVAIRGSSKVYVEGRQLIRVGDPIDCGSVASSGSPNVFAGG